MSSSELYQEKHSLLQAFSRQFAEAAQPDELLRKTEQRRGTSIRLRSVRTGMGESPADPLTHPTGDNEIVDACQIFLQLQKLLEILHLD